jgi:hypothetical protein
MRQNRKGYVMNKRNILDEVYNGTLTVKEAYDAIYTPTPRKASFFRMQMRIADEKAVSAFVNALFFFPIPVVIVKPFLKKYLKDQNISKEMLNEWLNTLGGTSIDVISEDAKIEIRLF